MRAHVAHVLLAALLLPLDPSAASTLPDPMRPPSAQERVTAAKSAASSAVPSRRWTLQGIVGGARTRLAIVNGRLVAAGERVGEARLIEIRADSIRLQQGRRSWLLHLPGSPDDPRTSSRSRPRKNP